MATSAIELIDFSNSLPVYQKLSGLVQLELYEFYQIALNAAKLTRLSCALHFLFVATVQEYGYLHISPTLVGSFLLKLLILLLKLGINEDLLGQMGFGTMDD